MTKAVAAGLHLNYDLSRLYRIKIFVFKIASKEFGFITDTQYIHK